MPSKKPKRPPPRPPRQARPPKPDPAYYRPSTVKDAKEYVSDVKVLDKEKYLIRINLLPLRSQSD